MSNALYWIAVVLMTSALGLAVGLFVGFVNSTHISLRRFLYDDIVDYIAWCVIRICFFGALFLFALVVGGSL